MKLSKRDIGLLLILLGIGVFLVCYLAVFNPRTADNEMIQTQINNLKPELDELKAKEARRPEFDAGIEEARETIREIQDGFPKRGGEHTLIREEDFIMYAVALENTVGIDTAGMKFTQAVQLAETVDIVDPNTGELDFEAKYAFKVNADIDAYLTYDHLKDVVRHAYGPMSTKTTLDSISISYNSATGVLYGTISVGKYCMSSDPAPYFELTDIPPMPIGVPNPFGTLDHIPEPGETINTGEEETDEEEIMG